MWQDATQREPVDLSVRRTTPPCQLKHSVSTNAALTLARQSSPAHRRPFTAPDVNLTSNVRSQPAFVSGNTDSLYLLRGEKSKVRVQKVKKNTTYNCTILFSRW